MSIELRIVVEKSFMVVWYSHYPLLPLVPGVTSANDEGDNEMELRAVHRSPGIYFIVENFRKLQLGDSLMKAV